MALSGYNGPGDVFGRKFWFWFSTIFAISQPQRWTGKHAKGDILFSPRKAPIDHRNSSSINHHFLIVLSPSGCASTKFHKFIKATEPATELFGDDDH